MATTIKIPPHGGSNAAHPMYGFAPGEGLPDLDIPNLDDMDYDDLWSLGRAIDQLQSFISNRQLAYKARTEGRIQDALKHERTMEFIYRDLPENWRW